jgi:hypothetical protein
MNLDSQIGNILEELSDKGVLQEGATKNFETETIKSVNYKTSSIYPKSLTVYKELLFFMAKLDGIKRLFLISKNKEQCEHKLFYHKKKGYHVYIFELTWETYLYCKEFLPWIAPVSLRNKKTTFGCGDRLGRATPGHIRACQSFNIYPVLAQQSVRELAFTNRTYKDVVKDAAFLVLQEGYKEGYGADGDHLKYFTDIQKAVEAGMPMITLDLTEKMCPDAQEWSPSIIEENFKKFPTEYKTMIEKLYAGKNFKIENYSIVISPTEAKRCALMYKKAIDYTVEVDTYLKSKRGDAYDLEVSIDETSVATEPAHHIFIAAELQRKEVAVNSLAPRFIGEFQKGIDYIGNINAFENDFKVHSAIAQKFGEYKISIHSGSDKFSVYPIIGAYSNQRIHVKTSGTSWLEALHAVSLVNPELFRTIYRKARDYAEEGLKQYHITSDFSKIPLISTVEDDQLPNLLNNTEARQMLHICYGQMLKDMNIRTSLLDLLDTNEEIHYQCVENHIQKHITYLGLHPKK